MTVVTEQYTEEDAVRLRDLAQSILDGLPQIRTDKDLNTVLGALCAAVDSICRVAYELDPEIGALLAAELRKLDGERPTGKPAIVVLGGLADDVMEMVEAEGDVTFRKDGGDA